MLAFFLDVNTMVYLIFDFSVLSDFYGARLNGCLSFQRFFVIGKYERCLLSGGCISSLADAT